MSVATAPTADTPYRPSAKFVGLMGAMTALGAVSIDMYLPSLPRVAADLGTTTGAVQFTISGTLIGAAVGQLLVGPLSDRFGRRAPALAGIALHVLASLLCMVVPNIAALVVLRMIQGVGNAAAAVTASAVIRDRLTGAPAARVFSRLILVIGMAPLLAPTLGGAVAGVAGWRSVFGLLALVGVVVFVVVWRFLPETLSVEARTTRGVGEALRGYRTLLVDRHFMALAVLPGLALATVLSYVAAAPFVLQLGFGLTEGQFALIFALNGLGGIIASQVNAGLLSRHSPVQLMRVMLPVTVLVGLVVLAVALTGFGGLLGLLVPLWVLLSIHIFVPPNARALAMTLRGERAGTAAALIGALQVGIAGVVSSLVAVAGGGAVAMATVIVGALVTAFLVALLGTPAYRRGRDDSWAQGAPAGAPAVPAPGSRSAPAPAAVPTPNASAAAA